MAVQKSRKTPSKRNMRRSHDALKSAALSVDPVTDALHRRHHIHFIGDDGYYRGRKRIQVKKKKSGKAPQSGRVLAKSGRKVDAPPIECPEIFSLSENFSGVTEVLHQIRERTEPQRQERNERTYINFRKIRKLSPAAALVLAAELDRWNKIPKKHGPLKTVDVLEWDPQIRRLLGDMGFFDLLRVVAPATPEENEKIRYVKFHTGKKADGEAIVSLRKEHLDPVVGGFPGKRSLYAAVTEAMTNVVHHAYEKTQSGLSFQKLHNWWLSASYNSADREVTILLYDQGVGIPETLPRKFREQLRGLVTNHNDHAQMIKAAHDLSRSANEKQHRGHGLQRDVRAYLQNLNCLGQYRVASLKGEYIYRKLVDGTHHEDLENHDQPLHGTLIEWKLWYSRRVQNCT